MAHRILAIDDDPAVLKYLTDFLGKRLGYIVQPAASGQEALDYSLKTKYDLCIIDVNLPDLTGSELYLRLREQMPETEAIFFTGVADFDKTRDFLRFALPEERVVAKPLNDSGKLTRLIVGILGPPKP